MIEDTINDLFSKKENSLEENIFRKIQFQLAKWLKKTVNKCGQLLTKKIVNFAEILRILMLNAIILTFVIHFVL